VEQHSIRRATRRTVLAGIAATLAPRAQAQQRDGMRRIGVLMPYLANDPLAQGYAAALVQGLGALNWKEDGNLRIDWRWGDDPVVIERSVAELIATAPDAILIGGASTALEALQRQTSKIPIVFTLIVDPVAQGFVASLSHPGGNITGFSAFDPPMAKKWMGMLTQITPSVGRIAVLFNPATTPYANLLLRGIQEAAPSFAVTAQAAPVHDDAEIEVALAGLARDERGGVLVLPNFFANTHREAIVAVAARYHLPAVYPFRFFPAGGGLMSYGIDRNDQFRSSAAYVDRILKGAKPSDLPVQNPTKFELVINLKTAKALGVTIAPLLLATADEVIE
jgi:putative tryptophan/tyrosine transport system substrate-binding protein